MQADERIHRLRRRLRRRMLIMRSVRYIMWATVLAAVLYLVTAVSIASGAKPADMRLSTDRSQVTVSARAVPESGWLAFQVRLSWDEGLALDIPGRDTLGIGFGIIPDCFVAAVDERDQTALWGCASWNTQTYTGDLLRVGVQCQSEGHFMIRLVATSHPLDSHYVDANFQDVVPHENSVTVHC